MDLFGRHARQERSDLKDRVRRCTEQRDYHHGRAERAQDVVRRIAAKFLDAHVLCWGENARLHDMVDGYQNLLARHARLLRACAGYRDQMHRLRSELRSQRQDFTERLIALEDRLSELQDANEHHYRDFAELAAASSPPAEPAAA